MNKFYLVFLSMWISTEAYTCSCFPVPMSIMKITNSDLVFEGKVISKEEVTHRNDELGNKIENEFINNFIKYTFKISERIFGDYDSDYVTIYSSSQGSSCGVNFPIGETYYIFSYKNDGVFSTDLCMKNMKKSKASKGFKKVICDFKKGRDDNKWHDENGDFLALGQVINKEPAGQWYIYHQDSSLHISGHYINGKRDGRWTYYRDKQSSQVYYNNLDSLKKSQISNPLSVPSKSEIFVAGEMIERKFFNWN